MGDLGGGEVGAKKRFPKRKKMQQGLRKGE